MGKREFVGELEQMVLLTILQCGGEAFAITVRERLEQGAGRKLSRGALYRTLDRLEEKGHLTWRLESGGSERGGHSRRHLKVSARGLRVLRHSRTTLTKLWRGLEEVLGRP